MRATTDTIAAIATPAGRGGVGIVRVAGADLSVWIDAIVGIPLRPRVATFAAFRDGDGGAIDQGLAIHFPAPHSYTGDDVLELQGHGGRAVLDALLMRCLALGARLAAPGEFTQRAFLNDKIDLAQAESVADLIDAATTTAARAAARSLTGEFSRAIGAIVAALVELRMFIEASLDFPDEDVGFVDAHDARGRLAALAASLDALTLRARTGVRLREGLSVVLIGRPNVGKSSLMNRLVREDAAIVTPVPGTTRDTVERPIAIAGIPLTLIDTAGLRDTDDVVEKVGIARTLVALDRADIAIVITDATAAAQGEADALPREDAAIVARLPASMPRIVVRNKIDLGTLAAGVEHRDGATLVRLSALTGEGVEALEQAMLGAIGVGAGTDDSFIARARHVAALSDAARHVGDARARIAERVPALELVAEDLRAAQHALGTITGAFTADDLLGVIFSRFCIGK